MTSSIRVPELYRGAQTTNWNPVKTGRIVLKQREVCEIEIELERERRMKVVQRYDSRSQRLRCILVNSREPTGDRGYSRSCKVPL